MDGILKMLTHEIIRELLDFDQQTKIWRWRQRPQAYFKSKRTWKMWNTRYAGKIAGCERDDGHIVIKVFGRNYLSHRLEVFYLTGLWPEGRVRK